ncbi:MAG: hypothetical protein WC412_06980 [Candidatus Omnitrophota bacterium]|jgi:hypothetical protein
MTKQAKKAPSLSSSKEKLKKNADLLPAKDPAEPAKDPIKVQVIEDPAEPAKDPGIGALVDQIKATGVLKNVFCNGFDFALIRTKRSRLSIDERAMLEDPLNRLEVKILEMLPEYIRKQAEKGGPIIDLTAAVIMIVWAKNQELKALTPKDPVKPAKDPGKGPVIDDPVKPAKDPADPASVHFDPTASIDEKKQ